MIEDPFTEENVNAMLVRLRNENLEYARNAAQEKDEWMVKKAQNWLTRWGNHITTGELLDKIIADDDLARMFAKDPQKQSFHENLGLRSMQDFGLEVRGEPKSGTNAIYIHNGRVKTGLQKKPEARIKSVDCTCLREGWKDYILQKWIAESGGAQDNQYSDIQGFVEQGYQYAVRVKDNVRIIALVDGPYFTDDKINELRATIPVGYSDRVMVMSTFEYMCMDG